MGAFNPTTLFLISLSLHSFYLARSEPYIGVNIGLAGDNMPKAEDTVKLLKSTRIEKVKLYGADAGIIKGLADSDIEIVVGASNPEIPGLTNPDTAGTWVYENVLKYQPASKIKAIAIGDEVLTTGDHGFISMLVPAMQNVQNALNAAQVGEKIKVTTVHSMSVLSRSDPPSAGAFDPKTMVAMKAVLQFLQTTGSPFMIKPYPYFAYQYWPAPENLDYCLFQTKEGRERVDPGNGNKYKNMFAAQLDAVKSALKAADYNKVEIVVGETGWPSKGDPSEAVATVENAQAYNKNLLKFLETKEGTPLMPGKPIDTYIFSLYDEDKRPGPASQRSFGLFKPDLSMAYDVGLNK